MTTKDPSARLDFAWDWKNPAPGETRGWLDEGETITDHEVTVISGGVTDVQPNGVDIDGTDENAGVVTAWVIGGVAGTAARLTCHVITSDGREDDRTRTISIRER